MNGCIAKGRANAHAAASVRKGTRPRFRGRISNNINQKITMPKNTAIRRRAFLNAGVVASLSIPLGTLPVSVPVHAAGKAKLDPENPLAQSLNYAHDAAGSKRTSDADKCRAYLHFQGEPGDTWGGCNIFSENLVNANGWCNAFSKRE